MAGWGRGDSTAQGFKTTDGCPVGYFASSGGDGRELSRGIQRTGGFLEAAQVELVNYKMPHLRSVT